MMLNEIALRKPEFQDGVKVRLADGQAWSFPLPKIHLAPEFAGEGSVSVGLKPTGMGLDYDRHYDVLTGAKDADPVDTWVARFSCAATLLRANYAVTNDDISSLFRWCATDPESDATWNQIDAITRGVHPKEHSPDTCD
jgi:hypothetical protein